MPAAPQSSPSMISQLKQQPLARELLEQATGNGQGVGQPQATPQQVQAGVPAPFAAQVSQPLQNSVTPDSQQKIAQQLAAFEQALAGAEAYQPPPVSAPRQEPPPPIAVHEISAPVAPTSPSPSSVPTQEFGTSHNLQPAPIELPELWQAAVSQAQEASFPGGSVGAKERFPGASSLDAAPVDVGGVQYVEQERSAEIPVEVESFLQEVQEHEQQIPHEIVVAGDEVQINQASFPAQPVIVLPFDEDTEKQARFKSAHWSVSWLVAFGRKVMKMFAGRVVYRAQPEPQDG